MSKNKKPTKWMKLDNAALIYPATMNRSWTALFRLSATLTEPIDGYGEDAANKALLAIAQAIYPTATLVRVI